MKSADKCPSFTVISLSADGDVQAIEKVLKHYDAYRRILALSYFRCITSDDRFFFQIG